MTLTDTAKRIHQHLRRIEADSALNNRDIKTRAYFNASACRGGNRVILSYISYQGVSSLTRSEAEEYLAWLDEGHVGSHYEQQREARP